eukprot:COSAG02_NODE_997_length_15333_cov_13.688526_15_plen_644_part_00
MRQPVAMCLLCLGGGALAQSVQEVERDALLQFDSGGALGGSEGCLVAGYAPTGGCAYRNDGMCDESIYCAPGTDTADCCLDGQPRAADESGAVVDASRVECNVPPPPPGQPGDWTAPCGWDRATLPCSSVAARGYYPAMESWHFKSTTWIGVICSAQGGVVIGVDAGQVVQDVDFTMATWSDATKAAVIGRLEDLAPLTYLQFLSVYNCPSITGDIMELQGLTSLSRLYVKNAPGVYGNHANLIAAIPALGQADSWGSRSNLWGDFCNPVPGAHYFQGEFACPVTTTLDAPDLLGADPCTCCDAPTFVRDTASGECVGAFLSLAVFNTLPRRKLHFPKHPLTPLPLWRTDPTCDPEPDCNGRGTSCVGGICPTCLPTYYGDFCQTVDLQRTAEEWPDYAALRQFDRSGVLEANEAWDPETLPCASGMSHMDMGWGSTWKGVTCNGKDGRVIKIDSSDWTAETRAAVTGRLEDLVPLTRSGDGTGCLEDLRLGTGDFARSPCVLITGDIMVLKDMYVPGCEFTYSGRYDDFEDNGIIDNTCTYLDVRGIPGVHGNHVELLAANPGLVGEQLDVMGDSDGPKFEGSSCSGFTCAGGGTPLAGAADLLGSDDCTCCDAPTFVRDERTGTCLGACACPVSLRFCWCS